jgi:hypothetical protein
MRRDSGAAQKCCSLGSPKFRSKKVLLSSSTCIICHEPEHPADATQARLTIYDYDQSMLVWRDLPNPSHMAFRRGVNYYRDAVIWVLTPRAGTRWRRLSLICICARLMWNPQEDIDRSARGCLSTILWTCSPTDEKILATIFDAWKKRLPPPN